jgi:hypothetical protein
MTSLCGVLAREHDAGHHAHARVGRAARLPVDQTRRRRADSRRAGIVGHRPLNELFELILDLSIQAVGAERGVLMTLEGEIWSPGLSAGSDQPAVRDRVARERASLLRDTALDEAFKARDSIVGQQVQSVMAVPLQTNDRVIGLINVDSRSFARPFTPDDLTRSRCWRTSRPSASSSSAWLWSSRNGSRAISSRPRSSSRGCFRTRRPRFRDSTWRASTCRAARSEATTSIFPYPDGRIGLVLGDVSGKDARRAADDGAQGGAQVP